MGDARGAGFQPPVHSRHGKKRYPGGSAALQRVGAGGSSRARGHNIVDQQDAPSLKSGPAEIAAGSEGIGDVLAPTRIAEAGLHGGRPDAHERRKHGKAGTAGYDTRQQLRLVEAALPAPAPMERDGNDGVEPLVTRKRGHSQIGQRRGEGPNAAVLIQMDQFPEDAFVGAETICRIKTTKAAAAQSAAAFEIEWEAILERRPATGTEEFGLYGFG